MKRTLLIFSMTLMAALSSPALAQCEDVQAKVDTLTQQVQALTQQVIALQAKKGSVAPVPAKPAPVVKPAVKPDTRTSSVAAAPAKKSVGNGRAEAVKLYDRIDALLAKQDIAGAKQQLADFNTEYAGSDAAAWTRSLNRELEVVGKSAPEDWSIDKWFQGQSEVALDSNKPTVVVFWESWCPHCRNEVPKLQAVYDSYREQGLQVVGVTRLTRDANEATVQSFIDEHHVGYPMAKESGALAEYFNVKGIPAAAVVKDGQIVWRGHPTRLTDQMLSSWM